jgi:hypothetical protein
MDIETLKGTHAGKLLDYFLKIEEEQYPESLRQQVRTRHEKVVKFISEFGVDMVTLNTYTNMMQLSNSLTIDVFDSKRYGEGKINIDLGSEAWELWATRGDKQFDFRSWKWIPHIVQITMEEDD